MKLVIKNNQGTRPPGRRHRLHQIIWEALGTLQCIKAICSSIEHNKSSRHMRCSSSKSSWW